MPSHLHDLLMGLAERPLKRHPRLPSSQIRQENPFGQPSTLLLAIGIIRHNDSVEAVLVRRCDGSYMASHGSIFPGRHHGCWRWSPREGVGFMDGTRPDVEMVDRIERAVLLQVHAHQMCWRADDGGRAESRRPKQRKDCVVRAAALAMALPYDAVYDELAERGRVCSRGTAKALWQAWFVERGAVRLSYPALPGQVRTTLRDVLYALPTGRHVAQIAGHLVAIVDGLALDAEEPRWGACVYATWSFPSHAVAARGRRSS